MRSLTKTQWRNLWHSFRWMRSRTDEGTSLAWISEFDYGAAALVAWLLNRNSLGARA